MYTKIDALKKFHPRVTITSRYGFARCSDTLRQALAMGADRAIHIKTDLRTDQELQPLAVPIARNIGFSRSHCSSQKC